MERKDLIGKGLNKADSVVDKLFSFATTNRERIGKDIINGILLLIIFGIFGCFDFLNLQFRPDYLLSATYWTRTVSKAIAGICAYHIGINFSWDREIEKDDNLRENAEKYQRLIKFKDQKTFNDYVVNVFNPNEKKKAYIAHINTKLYRLNKHAKNKDILLYSSKNEQLKETNKYCVKRKHLEMLKSEEYIKNNIDSINVKYTNVDPIVFDLEIDGRGSYRGVKVKGNVYVGKAKQTFSVLLGMLGVSALLTSMGIGLDSEEWKKQITSFAYWLLTCCSDVGVVVWQTLRGFLSSRKIISQEMTLPLIGRNQILTSYIDYCIENNIETSKAKMVYDKVVENEQAQGVA